MAKTKKAAKKGGAKKAARATGKKTARKAAAPATTPQPRTVTPYLAVNDAARALDWYKTVFGAKETNRQPGPGGKVMHAALRIGDSEVYLSDIFPGSDMQDATRTGPSVNLHVASRNIDKWWGNAVANGAKVTMPIEDMFWGDRYGRLVDPFGHSWALSWKSKLSKAELEKKREAAMAQMAAP